MNEYDGIEYIVNKSKIKNIYLKIRNGQLIISCPLRIKEKEIQEIIKKKKEWIIKALEKESKKEQINPEDISGEQREYLKEKVEYYINKYSKELKLYPKKVTIKNMNTAWGSCSSKKNISISLKLALKTEDEIAYVVLHELCHLRYMNHSKQFWGLVEGYMPEHKETRRKLKSS